MATKIGTGDEVGDPYPCAKCYHYMIRGFRSLPGRSPARSGTYKVTRLVCPFFFLGGGEVLPLL